MADLEHNNHPNKPIEAHLNDIPLEDRLTEEELLEANLEALEAAGLLEGDIAPEHALGDQSLLWEQGMKRHAQPDNAALEQLQHAGLGEHPLEDLIWDDALDSPWADEALDSLWIGEPVEHDMPFDIALDHQFVPEHWDTPLPEHHGEARFEHEFSLNDSHKAFALDALGPQHADAAWHEPVHYAPEAHLYYQPLADTYHNPLVADYHQVTSDPYFGYQDYFQDYYSMGFENMYDLAAGSYYDYHDYHDPNLLADYGHHHHHHEDYSDPDTIASVPVAGAATLIIDPDSTAFVDTVDLSDGIWDANHMRVKVQPTDGSVVHNIDVTNASGNLSDILSNLPVSTEGDFDFLAIHNTDQDTLDFYRLEEDNDGNTSLEEADLELLVSFSNVSDSQGNIDASYLEGNVI